MNLKSFYLDRRKLKPLEIEISLLPGLPGIQFLGLPDQIVRESAVRIKCALKNSGFSIPANQTILVNLRPQHLRKNSRGLELAVALGIVWATEQASPYAMDETTFIYGELSLNGFVLKPDDLETHLLKNDFKIITGISAQPSRHQLLQVTELKDKSPLPINERLQPKDFQIRPRNFDNFKFSDEQRRLIEIICVGKHPILLAGPAGSGKTFLAKSTHSFLPPLKPDEIFEISETLLMTPDQINWRPVIAPHHSIPPAAFLGGGIQNFIGELAKAHKGVLILDELLEFKPAILESLREILETSQFTVSRSGIAKQYPIEILPIATTNLCPCGSYTPVARPLNCRFSATRCKGYLQRLSGPLVDRFHLIHYTDQHIQKKHLGLRISEKLEQVYQYKASINHEMELEYLAQELFDKWIFTSERRKLAAKKVAETLAHLDFSPEVKLNHVEEALDLCVKNFDRLNEP